MSNVLITEEPIEEISEADILSSQDMSYPQLEFGNHKLVIVSETVNNVKNSVLILDDYPFYYCGDQVVNREFLLKAIFNLGCVLTPGEICELDEELTK